MSAHSTKLQMILLSVCDGVMEELTCGQLKTIVTDYACDMSSIDTPNSNEECQIECTRDMTTHVCVGTPGSVGGDCRPVCK